jgi:multidrug efflux pump subunit AcrA (membrane-fusion protein)
MIMWRFKKAFLASLCLSILAGLVTVPVVKTHAQGTDPSGSAADKRWLAVAPGRVEPVSGLIKIAGPVAGVVDSVLVKANETVFAGQPLIRLRDQEARAQLASVAAQVAMRKRIRNKESAASGPPHDATPRTPWQTPRRPYWSSSPWLTRQSPTGGPGAAQMQMWRWRARD